MSDLHEAELLSIIMKKPELLTKISQYLKPTDFGNCIYQKIYCVCLDLQTEDKGINYVNIYEKMKKSLSATEIIGILKGYISSERWMEMAREIKEEAIKQTTSTSFANLSKKVKNGSIGIGKIEEEIVKVLDFVKKSLEDMKGGAS